ncbi:MAG: hypothetical protein LBV17_07225, partial [Treponema sp.]|nr:hypothetical protein [Treponema sp.]
FANYKGTDGILVHYMDHIAEPERYVWGFLVWDEAINEYKNVMDIWADEIDWSMFTDFTIVNSKNNISIIEFTEEDKNSQPVIDTEEYTPALIETSTEERAIPFWAWIAIDVGIIAIVGCIALFAVKRKK